MKKYEEYTNEELKIEKMKLEELYNSINKKIISLLDETEEINNEYLKVLNVLKKRIKKI